MKSVYVGRKNDNQVAVAFDILVIGDPKVLGALLKLTAESGLIVDRENREDVIFMEPVVTLSDEKKDRFQMRIDFDKPAAGEGRIGPAEMGEGFACNYSGACPHENKSCTACEYAGSIFQKTDNPPADFMSDEPKAEEGSLTDEIAQSPFMQWASESSAGEPAGDEEAAGVDAPVQPVEALDMEEEF